MKVWVWVTRTVSEVTTQRSAPGYGGRDEDESAESTPIRYRGLDYIASSSPHDGPVHPRRRVKGTREVVTSAGKRAVPHPFCCFLCDELSSHLPLVISTSSTAGA